MGSAGTVGRLIDEEREVCADLEAVLLAEREALESFSSEAVARCVREKFALQGKLARLVECRRQAVRMLAGELGIDTDDGRIVPLLQRLPLPVATRLREAVGALRKGLIRTRRIQRVNGALVDESLRLVGEVIQAYSQFLPGTRYDRRAMVKAGPAPDGIDQRA